MVEGKQREAWNHTSHILATVLNVNRGSRHAKTFSPAECNPYLQSDARANRPQIKDVGLLARMFGLQPTNERAKPPATDDAAGG